MSISASTLSKILSIYCTLELIGCNSNKTCLFCSTFAVLLNSLAANRCVSIASYRKWFSSADRSALTTLNLSDNSRFLVVSVTSNWCIPVFWSHQSNPAWWKSAGVDLVMGDMVMRLPSNFSCRISFYDLNSILSFYSCKQYRFS
jgi:hypothetical protein